LFSKSFRVVLISVILAVTVQAQVQDTINKKTPLFVGKDALLLGAFMLGTAVVAPIDMRVTNRLQDSATQAIRFLSKAATGFRLLGDPGSLVTGTGIYLIGRAGENRRVEALGLHSVESILVADILGGGIKMLAGRQRPFVDTKNPYNFQLWRGFSGDQYRSFPSGHTITAFAFASTVTRESQFWWPHSAWYVGTVFYGGASLVERRCGGGSARYDRWAQGGQVHALPPRESHRSRADKGKTIIADSSQSHPVYHSVLMFGAALTASNAWRLMEFSYWQSYRRRSRTGYARSTSSTTQSFPDIDRHT
jgi:membrane-associated phospholipid phosphatase